MLRFFSSKDDQKAQEDFNAQVRVHMEMLESQARSLEASVTSQELTIQKILLDSHRNKEATSRYPPQQVQYSYNQEYPPIEGEHGYPQHGNSYPSDACVDNLATAHQGGTYIETILGQLLQQTQMTLHAQVASIKAAVEVHRGLLQKVVPDLSVKLKGTKDVQTQASYNEQVSNLKKECEELRRSKDSSERNYRETLLGMERQEEELKLKIERIEKSQKQLETRCNDLKRSESKLKGNISKLEKEKKVLEKKVTEFETVTLTGQGRGPTSWYPWAPLQQPRKSVIIQIFCPRKTDLMTVAVTEMATMLRTQFDIEQIDLADQRVENIGAIDRNKPVIVICMNASRLGTDVGNALLGLVLNSKLAVVILHHKESHALPSQSSDRVLTSPEYKQLGAIVDMAFLSTKGVYSCDMNNRALDQLKAFINSHS